MESFEDIQDSALLCTLKCNIHQYQEYPRSGSPVGTIFLKDTIFAIKTSFIFKSILIDTILAGSSHLSVFFVAEAF